MSELVLSILVVGTALAVAATLVVEDAQPATARRKSTRASRRRHGHAARPSRPGHAPGQNGRTAAALPVGASPAPAAEPALEPAEEPAGQPALAHTLVGPAALQAPGGPPPLPAWTPSSARARASARTWAPPVERGEADSGVRWWQRVRSAVLLTVGVVLLGVGTAAVIGIVVVVLVTVLRASLGAG